MKTNFAKLFENPHEEVEKMNSAELKEAQLNKSLSRELARGQAPYSDSRRPLYRVAAAFSWLSNGYSFLTGGFTASYLFYLQLGFMPKGWALTTAISGGVIAALLLETAKRSANDQFFFEVVFIKKVKSGAWPAVLVTAIISISASFYAATKIPKAVAASPELVNVDSIQNYYQQIIQGKNQLIAEITEKGTWKGTLTQINQQTLLELQQNIQGIETKRDSSLAVANLENKTRLSTALVTNEQNGQLLGWMTIGSELLFIGCFWYQKRYRYKAAAERNFLQDADNMQPNNMGGFVPPKNPIIDRHKIGFELPFMTANKTPQTTVITDDTANVVFIKGTVTHIDKTNGEEKELTEKEVQHFINTYAKRVNESLRKLEVGVMGDQERAKATKVLHERLNNLRYWRDKKEELLSEFKKYKQHSNRQK